MFPPLEKLAREREERRKHVKDEAPLRRLTPLKQYGLNQIGWGIPDSWHARVAAAFESYVTLNTFPRWGTHGRDYQIVPGKDEEDLHAYHDDRGRKQTEA